MGKFEPNSIPKITESAGGGGGGGGGDMDVQMEQVPSGGGARADGMRGGESADDGSQEVDALWGHKDEDQKLEHHEGPVRLCAVEVFLNFLSGVLALLS